METLLDNSTLTTRTSSFISSSSSFFMSFSSVTTATSDNFSWWFVSSIRNCETLQEKKNCDWYGLESQRIRLLRSTSLKVSYTIKPFTYLQVCKKRFAFLFIFLFTEIPFKRPKIKTSEIF